jgi:hypothetical protein
MSVLGLFSRKLGLYIRAQVELNIKFCVFYTLPSWYFSKLYFCLISTFYRAAYIAYKCVLDLILATITGSAFSILSKKA